MNARWRALLAAMLSAVVLHATLAGGALSGLPVPARLVLAFLALVLLPGHGWLAALGIVPPGSAWLASGWALGFGVAWLGLQVLLLRLLHLPLAALAAWGIATGALPWVAALALPSAPMESRAANSSVPLAGLALVAVLVAATLAAAHVGRLPPPIGFNSDSPDHIGTIRRIMNGGDAFPVDAFFRDAGAGGADPRKGLWHPSVALLAMLAHADPLDAWRVLAAPLAALFVLNAAAFGFVLGGPVAAAVAAWALLLTYGGTLLSQGLSEAVFATKLADQLALATATAVLLDLEQRDRRARIAAVGLAAGAIAAHVFAALQFAVVFGALGVGLLVRERGPGPNVRRLVATSLALGLPCIPYLWWRAHASYAPSNIIHTAPQGLMVLAGRARVVDPSVLWDWMGNLWVIFPLSWWGWTRASSRTPVLYLLTTSIAVALLLFFPPLVGILQPRVGYLLMRFVWLMPLCGALAFAIPTLTETAVFGRGFARFSAALGLAGLVLLCLPAVRAAARLLVRPAIIREHQALDDPLRWRDALEWMDTHLPAGSVVLSDPATSYSIPMMTRDYVVTLVDQHSSPNDSLALRRILDARDALDPYAPWAATQAHVRRWGATAIALNDRFLEPPHLDYWAPDHAWYAAARARLESAPGAFRRVWDTGDFVVYRIEPAGLDALVGGGRTRECLRPWTAAADSAARPVAPGMPEMVALHLAADHARRGDSLAVTLDWHARMSMPAGSYIVALRFDRTLPAGFAPPVWCAKPARKIYERLHHERYRFRVDRVPLAGTFGVDLWPPSSVVRDSFTVPVPRDVATGDYEVQVTMVHQPHYPILQLSDYFLDHDYLSGIPAGRLRIERSEALPEETAHVRH